MKNRILAIILLVVMFVGFIPLTVSAVSEYATMTDGFENIDLDELTDDELEDLYYNPHFKAWQNTTIGGISSYTMHELIQKEYSTGASWTRYYHPADFPNVWVMYPSNGASQRLPENAPTMYIIYYKDSTVISAGSGTGFSEEVMIYTAPTDDTSTSMEKVEKVLFEGGTYDFQLATKGETWSITWIYSGTDYGYRHHAAVSVESYYYDYYYEKYGYYPTTTDIEINYMCNGENILTERNTCLAGETIAINQLVSTPAKYEIETISINETDYTMTDNFTFTSDTIITVNIKKAVGADAEETNNLLSQIIETLNHIMTGKYLDALDTVLPNAKNLIIENLSDNDFFTSITAIKNSLTSLFEEDYTDRNGFYELGLFSINVGKPAQDVYTDYGNEMIGEWRVGTIQTGTIDWGINNVNVLNLDWFFGRSWEQNGNTYYTKGVKDVSDAIIGAFMWFLFGWYLWKNLPDMINGDIGVIADYTGKANAIKHSEKKGEQK